MFWKNDAKKMFIANVAIMIPGILCTTMFIPNGYKILAYPQGYRGSTMVTKFSHIHRDTGIA